MYTYSFVSGTINSRGKLVSCRGGSAAFLYDFLCSFVVLYTELEKAGGKRKALIVKSLRHKKKGKSNRPHNKLIMKRERKKCVAKCVVRLLAKRPRIN